MNNRLSNEELDRIVTKDLLFKTPAYKVIASLRELLSLRQRVEEMTTVLYAIRRGDYGGYMEDDPPKMTELRMKLDLLLTKYARGE